MNEEPKPPEDRFSVAVGTILGWIPFVIGLIAIIIYAIRVWRSQS